MFCCNSQNVKQPAGLKPDFGFLGHYYIIITCYESNNGSVITYLYNIIAALLHVSTHVITSIFTIITVIRMNQQ